MAIDTTSDIGRRLASGSDGSTDATAAREGDASTLGFPVVCENPAHELRGGTVVELEHAAEALTAPNRACADQRGLGRDALIAQTLVRPFLMVVINKRSHGSPEVYSAKILCGHDLAGRPMAVPRIS
jgi:hypothetical protein